MFFLKLGDRTDFDDQARDHVLANCPEALKDIEMAVTKCPNLMLLPTIPVGNMVEGHLDYLGKVIKSWRRYSGQCEGWTETQVQEVFVRPRSDTVVKPDIPMYSTPATFVHPCTCLDTPVHPMMSVCPCASLDMAVATCPFN